MSADRIIMRCAICGKEKPDATSTWARTATCCDASRWVSSVTFTNALEGPVVHGDVRYGSDAGAADRTPE